MDSIFKSSWITYEGEYDGKIWDFFKKIKIDKEIKKATLYSSAIGTYSVYVNDNKADVYHLAPGYTFYPKRVQYQMCDITKLLNKGNNVFELKVGYGFLTQINSHEHPPRENLKSLDAYKTAVIASIELEYKTGEKEFIYTNETWKAKETIVRYSDMYNGETIDYTFNSDKEYPVIVVEDDKNNLIPQEGEIIKKYETFDVQEYIKTKKNEDVYDFGQNMTGHFVLETIGEKDDKILIECGEMLDKDGNFYNENYREAKARLEIICDGNKHRYETDHVFYGFRYIRVTKSSENAKILSIKAVVVHSEMDRIGDFETSNKELNQLYHNIIWGQKGNFVDIPTDCPQRDERLGWLGDAQVFCSCASMNFNTKKFFKKWLGDMRVCQRENGRVQSVIPSCWSTPSAAWADACVIIPYNLYMQYGDKDIIQENYDMMEKWITYLDENFDEYTKTDKFHYGDWLALEQNDTYIGLTPREFIATAYSIYSVRMVIECADILGKDKTKLIAFYNKAYTKMRKDFVSNDLYKKNHPDTQSNLDTQTYYVLMLHFHLYESEEERIRLAKRLNDKVVDNGYKLQTGFVGTPYLLFALSLNGYTDTAYSLLLQREYPSWIYPITKGATTMWEHWDGFKTNGEFWDKKMNSFNHYAYGSVGEWMYKEMAGINYIKPGYDEIIFTPKTDTRIEFVKASLKTKHGKIFSSWKKDGNTTIFTFTVPKSVKAKAIINNKEYTLESGENKLTI